MLDNRQYMAQASVYSCHHYLYNLVAYMNSVNYRICASCMHLTNKAAERLNIEQYNFIIRIF